VVRPLRPDRDAYFLAGAQWASQRAECSRRKVGALLVLKGKIRGHGYNGALPGMPNCLEGACPRGALSASECPPNSDYANCIADHAERNAVRNTDPRHVAGSTLYVSAKPCPSCWTLIGSVGITRTVWPGGEK
jgi:dCMP deaminase